MPRLLIHKVILSLGSNLGDRVGWLRQAASAISELNSTAIKARSAIYETEAVGVPAAFSDQPFLNAVIILKTALTAQQLSDAVHHIEDTLKRSRSIPNQPRTIDIDIISFDNIISDAVTLTLPHPRAHQRRFVLEPLAEIAPHFILPGQIISISDQLAKLPATPFVKAYAEQWS